MSKEWVSDHSINTKFPLIESHLIFLIRLLGTPFEVIEFNAGKGVWNHNGVNVKGSSIRVIETMKTHIVNEDWFYTGMEKLKASFYTLYENAENVFDNGILPSQVCLLNTDSTGDYVTEYFDKKSNNNGLIIVDPGGNGSYNYWYNLAYLSRIYKNMDILIHFGAAMRKRGKFQDIPIECINKKHCYINMQDGSKQFTFIYFCNKIRQIPMFVPFHSIKSEIGQDLLYIVNNTAS